MSAVLRVWLAAAYLRESRSCLVGGNGLGPFGSPARQARTYVIRVWGEVEYIDRRAWQCLANQVK